MIIIEDDGTNESIIQEEVIDTQLYEGGNNYFIIPVDKNNNLINFKVDIKGHFSYHNKPKQPNQQNSESSSYIYYIIGGTLFGIIILVIFIVLMIKKKHNKMNKSNEDLMSYNINDTDNDNED
jgi:ATP-dependent Zn protease